jgi:hypothetical protein
MTCRIDNFDSAGAVDWFSGFRLSGLDEENGQPSGIAFKGDREPNRTGPYHANIVLRLVGRQPRNIHE